MLRREGKRRENGEEGKEVSKEASGKVDSLVGVRYREEGTSVLEGEVETEGKIAKLE